MKEAFSQYVFFSTMEIRYEIFSFIKNWSICLYEKKDEVGFFEI